MRGRAIVAPTETKSSRPMSRQLLQRALLSLLPRGAACELSVDGGDATLFPEEREAVRNAIDARRAEFAQGRSCARRALASFGVPARPIGVGPRREPLWPEGFVGSITHSGNLVAAAVARSRMVRALGIDAEVAVPLPSDVRGVVLNAAERVDGGHGKEHETVVFSAKESVFKALFPLTRAWIDFADLVVETDEMAGTFCARPTRHDPLWDRHANTLAGRFTVTGGYVLTACYKVA